MSLFGRKPWYVGGLAFECARCGQCCAGPREGYVWLNEQELLTLAVFLHLDAETVLARYVRLVDGRMSLIESPRTKDCVFLTRDSDRQAGCAVYLVRPAQCRTWPFWPGNLPDADTWARAGRRCPGINRGPLHDLPEIERKRDETCD